MMMIFFEAPNGWRNYRKSICNKNLAKLLGLWQKIQPGDQFMLFTVTILNLNVQS